jgi:hypothetical protein
MVKTAIQSQLSFATTLVSKAVTSKGPAGISKTKKASKAVIRAKRENASTESSKSTHHRTSNKKIAKDAADKTGKSANKESTRENKESIRHEAKSKAGPLQEKRKNAGRSRTVETVGNDEPDQRLPLSQTEGTDVMQRQLDGLNME